MSDLGDCSEARTTFQEAVQLRRALAADNPTRYTPDLARSLTKVGTSLRALGEQSEAVLYESEAVAYWWHLTQLHPDEFDAQYNYARDRFTRILSENGHDPSEVLTAELAARARVQQHGFRRIN